MRYEAVFSGGKLNPTTQQLTLALTMSGQNQAGSALLADVFQLFLANLSQHGGCSKLF
jgi:hypothetical protein